MSTKQTSNQTPVGAEAVLHVTVGESLAESGQRAVQGMEALQRGEPVRPHFGVSFTQMTQMLSAFTPRRWESVAVLREGGPMTVAELARRLGRHYKNVHTDVAHLIEWLAVERTEDDRVPVPWSEIIVDMKLPQRQAA